MYKLLRLYWGAINPAQSDRIKAESRLLAKSNYQQTFVQIEDNNAATLLADELQSDYQSVEANGWKKLILLGKLFKKHRPDVIYCHGFKAVLLAWLVKNLFLFKTRARVIYEIHGASAFESFYRHRQSLTCWTRFALLYSLERLAIFMADKYVLVSDEIKKYYCFSKTRPTLAIPRLVNPITEEAVTESEQLQKLEFFIGQARNQGKYVLVYSGSASQWQMIDETLRLMKSLLATNKFAICIFSQDHSFFSSALADSAEKNAWFLANFSRAELFQALSYCDIGILLRAKLILNRVASPTKLYQYFYNNLAVITTDVVSEAIAVIKETGAGIVLDSNLLKLNKNIDTLAECICQQLNAMQESRKKLAKLKQKFTWQGVERQYIKFLESK